MPALINSLVDIHEFILPLLFRSPSPNVSIYYVNSTTNIHESHCQNSLIDSSLSKSFIGSIYQSSSIFMSLIPSTNQFQVSAYATLLLLATVWLFFRLSITEFHHSLKKIICSIHSNSTAVFIDALFGDISFFIEFVDKLETKYQICFTFQG